MLKQYFLAIMLVNIPGCQRAGFRKSSRNNSKLPGSEISAYRFTSYGILLRHLCMNTEMSIFWCLKDILGHVNLGTTEIYTHLSNKDKMEAAERSPLANVRNVRSTLKSPKLDDNNTDLPDSDLSHAPRSNKKAKQ